MFLERLLIAVWLHKDTRVSSGLHREPGCGLKKQTSSHCRVEQLQRKGCLEVRVGLWELAFNKQIYLVFQDRILCVILAVLEFTL